jgi:hypothetical protein
MPATWYKSYGTQDRAIGAQGFTVA